MRPFRVVILPPGLNDILGTVQADEDIIVQAFIPKLAVEALNISVLNRLARLNESQLDAVLVSPEIKGLADELRSVIDSYHFWKSACQCILSSTLVTR